MGDSLVKRAGQAAHGTGRPHLDLDRQGFQLHWFGYSGIKLADLLTKFQMCTILNSTPPNFMVLNFGGNDLTALDLAAFKVKVHSDIGYIHSVLPKTQLVWLDILPRLCWRGMRPTAAKQMDLKRKRANRFGREAVCKVPGGHIISTNIDRATPGLYCDDGVHLSQVGVQMYLLTLKDALSVFITDQQTIKYVQT